MITDTRWHVGQCVRCGVKIRSTKPLGILPLCSLHQDELPHEALDSVTGSMAVAAARCADIGPDGKGDGRIIRKRIPEES